VKPSQLSLTFVNAEEDSEVREGANAEQTDEDNRYSYRVMLRRDKRRWSRADVDNDGELSKEEFGSFLHPEETLHMRDIIIDVRSGKVLTILFCIYFNCGSCCFV